MYNVNKEQIQLRLDYITKVEQIVTELRKSIQADSLIHQFALERAVHAAAESVTDIGNYMIDGFVMRDAASYEDIIDILYGEQVFPQEVYDVISLLVRLRKPLVQNYHEVNEQELLTLLQQLPEGLHQFAQCVEQYILKELI